MALSIIIPEIGKKPDSSKDAVISILTLEWPLSLRSIFYKIKKQYGYSSSYQAVYKAVKELKISKVLREKDKRYEINIEWIKNLQSFTDIVETNYYAKEKLQNLSGLKESKLGKDLVVMNFETVFDAEKYLYYFMKSELFKAKNDSVCYHLNNEWRPIFYLRAEYNYYLRLKKKGHRIYFICAGNSPLDKSSARFYRSIGVNYKIKEGESSNDTLVFGDFFIQIFIPEEIKKNIKRFLDKQDSLNLLTQALAKKTSIRIVINKDPSLAQEIKKQTIAQF